MAVTWTRLHRSPEGTRAPGDRAAGGVGLHRGDCRWRETDGGAKRHDEHDDKPRDQEPGPEEHAEDTTEQQTQSTQRVARWGSTA